MVEGFLRHWPRREGDQDSQSQWGWWKPLEKFVFQHHSAHGPFLSSCCVWATVQDFSHHLAKVGLRKQTSISSSQVARKRLEPRILNHPKMFVCLFFRAVPSAHGRSQARSWIRAAAAGLRQSHSNSVTYTTAHGNARSLTHWSRPGIEPANSWFLVRFVSIAPRQELLSIYLFLATLWPNSTYGIWNSWARDQIQAVVVTYTVAVAMLDSLTHCARPGSKPACWHCRDTADPIVSLWELQSFIL